MKIKSHLSTSLISKQRILIICIKDTVSGPQNVGGPQNAGFHVKEQT